MLITVINTRVLYHGLSCFAIVIVQMNIEINN